MKLDNRGNVAITVALCLPLIIGGAAFGIETGYWRYDQVRVQQAADAAAYAGAVVKRSGGAQISNTQVTSAATTAASSNGYTNATDTLVAHVPSLATPSDANSVEVVITRTEPPIFTAYVRCMVSGWRNNNCDNSIATVKGVATASFSTAGNACILALSPSASKAANFAGSSGITLDGCVVMSNSLASTRSTSKGPPTSPRPASTRRAAPTPGERSP